MNDTDTESSITYYSAVLVAPKIAEQYCPSCDEKASTRLCKKCRDLYICEYCAPKGVCKDCIFECIICWETRVKGDFLNNVCEDCEEKISDLYGDIFDESGLSHRNLIEMINENLRGKIITEEVISEEIYEYLNSQGILVEDGSSI